MERMDGVGPKRTQRVHRSITDNGRIVELVLQPGVSVARVAQAEGVNANQVFKWRRDYRSGQWVEAGTAAALMLPGRPTISVEHGADRALLQAILESLRK